MWIAWLVLVTACAHSAGSGGGDRCVVIEREQDLAGCVGKTVTVRGVVSRTKIPAILGVEVSESDLADQIAEATGVLATYTIPEDIDRDGMHSAHKGPGTYYTLRDPSGQGLATPHRVK